VFVFGGAEGYDAEVTRKGNSDLFAFLAKHLKPSGG
jgi:hypothetical protein